MSKVAWAACVLIVLSTASGCKSKGKGSSQDGDSIYLESIALTNEICDAIERDADPAVIAEINQRFIENEDKIEALPLEENYRLTKKYNEGLGRAGMRMAEVSIKHPGVQIGKVRGLDFNEMRRKMDAMKGKMPGKDAEVNPRSK
jgi:hypothetical protein